MLSSFKNYLRELWGSRLPAEFEVKYEVIRECGRGTFGRVLQVREKSKDDEKEQEEAVTFAAKVVSIKDVPKEYAMLEVHALEKLKGSEHIVGMVGWFLEEPVCSKMVILMDFVDGENLFDIVARNGPVRDMAKAVVLFRHLLLALRCMHREDLVHGDVKIENAVIKGFESDHAELTLIDLGTVAESGVRRKYRSNTEMYIAPEARSTPPHPINDLFSAGIFLHRMLCAVPPEYDCTSGPTAIMDTTVACYRNVPNLAKDLVLKLTTYDVEKRLTSTAALNHAWVVPSSLGKTVNAEDILLL